MGRLFLFDIFKIDKIRDKVSPKIRSLLKSAYSFINYGSYDFLDVFIIEIETITACNRRCSYCPNSRFDRGLIKNIKKMETELFHKLIDELSKLDFKGELHPHFYGEPLLDERLPQLIAYAKSRLPSIKIGIYTNGDFLTINLYKRLIASGVSGFNITRHPGQEPDNVKKVLDYRKKYGEDSVSVLYDRLDCINNRGGLVGLENATNFKDCGIPSRHITIDYDGNVILCCRDYFSTIKFGNIKSERLIDIWKKPYYRRIRRDLRKGIFEPEICKKCGWGKYRF